MRANPSFNLHFAAVQFWSSFQSRPISAHRKVQVNSNVRPHKYLEFTLRLHIILTISVLFIGCAIAPETKSIWIDITGNKRPDSILFQDHSTCLLVSQHVRNQAELTNPMPDANACRTCGAIMAATIIIRQQNIDNSANAAYQNCLGAKGWRRQ